LGGQVERERAVSAHRVPGNGLTRKVLQWGE
jgi:hypothetical protein